MSITDYERYYHTKNPWFKIKNSPKIARPMDDTFRIFVNRLKEGREERIEETLSPEFLDVHEAELKFQAPVFLKGSATVADEVLVLIFSIETEVNMPCAICNKEVKVKISIPDFCHTERLSEIKGSVFNYQEVLRQGVLLELPYIAECNGGDCPERAFLAQYLIHKGD